MSQMGVPTNSNNNNNNNQTAPELSRLCGTTQHDHCCRRNRCRPQDKICRSKQQTLYASMTTTTTLPANTWPTFIIFTLAVTVTSTSLVVVTATTASHPVKACNFDRYALGCYSQANLECDMETNTCRCISGHVLVDRLCLRRARANEVCRYNEQCDTKNNYRCVQEHPQAHMECSHQTAASQQIKCRCSLVSERQFEGDEGQEGDKQDEITESQLTPGIGPHVTPSMHPIHDKQKLSHASPGSILSRIVWISLIFILIVLISLLLLIKYQSFNRTIDRPFHRTDDDRLSISSEPDVPPPYEVAIRMKD